MASRIFASATFAPCALARWTTSSFVRFELAFRMARTIALVVNWATGNSGARWEAWPGAKGPLRVLYHAPGPRQHRGGRLRTLCRLCKSDRKGNVGRSG